MSADRNFYRVVLEYLKKSQNTNVSKTSIEGIDTKSYISSKETLIIPSDTNSLKSNWLGCNLFVDIQDETKRPNGVQVTLSLLNSRDTFITRYLSHGYHPIALYQIKDTDTDTTDVQYIAQF